MACGCGKNKEGFLKKKNEVVANTNASVKVSNPIAKPLVPLVPLVQEKSQRQLRIERRNERIRVRNIRAERIRKRNERNAMRNGTTSPEKP